MTVSNNSFDHSSIDRFFWSKGARFVGGFGGNGLAIGMLIGSGVQFLLALIFALVYYSSAKLPPIYPLFLITTAIFGTVSYWANKKRGQLIKTEVKLSSEGKKMLSKVGQHIGWYSPEQVYGTSNYKANWWYIAFGRKTAATVLSTEASLLLEQGCKDYNRIMGMLNLEKEAGVHQRAIAPKIEAASDEAVISLINQVALLDKNPESKSAIEGSALQQISNLAELADRYEQLIYEPKTVVSRFQSSTMMENVLSELRSESRAWNELNQLNSCE